MMRRRGRPIVAAAAVGHVAGKSAARAAGSQQAAEAPPEPDQAPAPSGPEPVAPPAPSAVDDQTAELTQLANLHTQGILTDEEFAAKKKQILGL